MPRRLGRLDLQQPDERRLILLAEHHDVEDTEPFAAAKVTPGCCT